MCFAEAQGFAEWFASQTGKNGFVRKCLRQRGPFKESMRRRNEIPGRFEGAVIDAPWTVHAPKLIIWWVIAPLRLYVHSRVQEALPVLILTHNLIKDTEVTLY